MGIGPTSRKWRPRPPPLLYFAVTGRGLDRIARFGAYANGLAIVPQPQRLMRPSAIKRRHVKSIRSDLYSVAKSVFEISAAVTPGWCAMRVSIASAIVTKSPRLSFRHDTGVSPILGSRRGDSSPRWGAPRFSTRAELGNSRRPHGHASGRSNPNRSIGCTWGRLGADLP
jgi:hypothetical protein